MNFKIGDALASPILYIRNNFQATGDENATLDKEEVQAAISEANAAATKHRQSKIWESRAILFDQHTVE